MWSGMPKVILKKQRVSYISKITLSMNYIFCKWLSIHECISMIDFIQMGVVRHTWACQKKFQILNLKYPKTKFNYDVEYLHIGSYP